jgi:hypothetical protein
MAIILKANKVNLFVSSVLCVFWYHSPNVSDTLHICNISWLRVNIMVLLTKTHYGKWFRCEHLHTSRMVMISRPGDSDEESNILICDSKNLIVPEREGNDLSDPP